MKCIVLIETGEAKSGHNLRNLFKAASPTNRREIENRWFTLESRPKRQRTRDAIKTLTGETIPLDFDWHFREGANAFVSLRYLHENDGFGTKFLLGDLPTILRTVIVDLMKPEWKNLTHGPITSVPGF